MKVIFIRHGEPNYECLRHIDLSFCSKNIAPLSSEGVLQAKQVAEDDKLSNSCLMICSPYTRALETAFLINRELKLPLIIEPDLREWECEIDFNPFNEQIEKEIEKEFYFYEGLHNDNCKYSWESLHKLGDRVFKCIKKYNNYDKIIVVCHAMIIRQFYYNPQIGYCEPIEFDFNDEIKMVGFYKE